MRNFLLIFFAICFLSIYIFSIMLFFGKGGVFLSGYHQSPTNVKGLKYHKYILRRAGSMAFVLALIAHAMCICFTFGIYIAGGLLAAVLIVLSIVVASYLNCKKMKRMEFLVKQYEIDINYQDEFSKNDLFYEYCQTYDKHKTINNDENHNVLCKYEKEKSDNEENE